MYVNKLENNDIITAKNLSHLVWGDFYKSLDLKIQNLIYNFTVEYYDLNRQFSFGCFDSDNELKGYLLAFKKNNKEIGIHELNKIVETVSDREGRNILYEFFGFLKVCGEETKQLMNDDDIMLGLFVSTLKGGGKLLLGELVKECMKNNIKNLYLWSDTSCDYDYYQKNDFETVKSWDTVLNSQKITVFIYKKSIEAILN